MGQAICTENESKIKDAKASSASHKKRTISSGDLRGRTPLWKGWMQVHTLRPSEKSWLRLDHSFYGAVYGAPQNLLLLRFGPEKQVAMRLDLHRFSGFWLGGKCADRKGVFLFFEAQKPAMQAKTITVNHLVAPALLKAFQAACPVMDAFGPRKEGWLEKCSVSTSGHSNVSGLTTSSAELQSSVFRPWQKRYFMCLGSQEKFFFYAMDRSAKEPKGFLPLANCSIMKTLIPESNSYLVRPEMVFQCTLQKDRLKLYRLRVVVDAVDSPRHTDTPLKRTREWAKLFSKKQHSHSLPTPKSRTAESATAAQSQTKEPKVGRTKTNHRRFKQGRRAYRPTAPLPEMPASTTLPSRSFSSTNNSGNVDHAAAPTHPSSPSIAKPLPKRRIGRRQSVVVRQKLMEWAHGKDIILLIEGLPDILPATSPALEKLGLKLRAKAAQIVAARECSISDLKKIYFFALKFCHPDKRPEVMRGNVSSKIICSEVFGMLQKRYDMMSRTFDETDQQIYKLDL